MRYFTVPAQRRYSADINYLNSSLLSYGLGKVCESCEESIAAKGGLEKCGDRDYLLAVGLAVTSPTIFSGSDACNQQRPLYDKLAQFQKYFLCE